MDKDKILEELKLIILKYITEKDAAEILIKRVNDKNIKGILVELDSKKSKKISDLDMEIIHYIYCQFC